MTMLLYDNSKGLFDILGKVFKSIETLHDGVLAADLDFEGVLAQYDNAPDDLALNAIIATINDARSANNSTVPIAVLQRLSQNYLTESVRQDVLPVTNTLDNALLVLIAQMRAATESVEASTVSYTLSNVSTGNGTVIVTTKRGDGLTNEFILAESIKLTATDDNGVSLLAEGDASVNVLSASWPAGSGLRLVIAVTSDSGLLTNGGFETVATDDATMPASWLVTIGTPGTSLYLTTPEQQTVAITATPTAGYYTLTFDGQTTVNLAYNATATTVRSALRGLTGLENVLVTATGTTPNYTHTVEFIGYGGNVALLTATNRMTGGTITITETVPGTAQVHRGGYALTFASNGSTLTAITQRIDNLTAATCYALDAALCVAVAGATGTLLFELVDGVGGAVINDDQGIANTITINAVNLSTSFEHLSALVGGFDEAVFRTPTLMPSMVYLRIRFSVSPVAAVLTYLDSVSLVQMVELYSGGLFVAAFTGSVPFRLGDVWSLDPNNDRVGVVHEWCHRIFGLGAKRLLLPSLDLSATIPDTVMT